MKLLKGPAAEDWYGVRLETTRGSTFVFSVQVRWWRPSFWRYVWNGLEISPAILKPYYVAKAVLYVARYGLRRE